MRADAALHDRILDDGDQEKAEAVSRARLKTRGLTDAQIDSFMGKPTAK